jgi:hypothetical protein
MYKTLVDTGLESADNNVHILLIHRVVDFGAVPTGIRFTNGPLRELPQVMIQAAVTVLRRVVDPNGVGGRGGGYSMQRAANRSDESKTRGD